MARQNKLLLNIDQNTTNEEKAMGRHNLGLADVAHTGSYNNQQGDLGDSSNIWIQNSSKNRYLCAASKRQQGTYAQIISGSGGFNDSYRIQVRLVKDS